MDLTPQQALSEEELQKGKRVLWGGMVINSTNLENQTRIEVLAYPLSRNHQPQTEKAPYGRFLLFHDGYLETVDYAAGRYITAVGRFSGSRSGRLDESTYTYPVLESEQLHLWPREEQSSNGNSSIHFGFGFLFSN